MDRERTYLDFNATAPLRPAVRDAVMAALEQYGNASSVHKEGRLARELIETARGSVARLVGGVRKNVIFTSGGTEANQMALSPHWQLDGWGASGKQLRHLFVSSIEHPSVLSGGGFAEGATTQLPVTPEGVVDLDAFERMLRSYSTDNPDAGFLVSVMGANNETGALQSIVEIARIAHDFGGLFHSDLVQLAGKKALNVNELGADMVSISAHKLGGPQGVGALVLGRDDLISGLPLLRGGGQEGRRRAGTENVAGIAGFGKAAEECLTMLGDWERLSGLQEKLECGLLAVSGETTIFCNEVSRLPNTTLFAVPGFLSETAIIALDLAGVAISAGSACSSGKVERSHVLVAMGVEDALNRAALRLSLGWKSTAADVDRFLDVWGEIYKRQKDKQAAA